MAVSLTTLVESLKRAVSPPGQNLYPSVNDAQWVGYLSDAFWQARLSGLLVGYKLSDDNTEVVPIQTGASDIGGDNLQLIAIFAGYNIALTAFQNINSSYKAKAGPVEYEVQKSATTLKALLDALKARMDFILGQLSTIAGNQTSVLAFDAVISATYQTACSEWGTNSSFVGG